MNLSICSISKYFIITDSVWQKYHKMLSTCVHVFCTCSNYHRIAGSPNVEHIFGIPLYQMTNKSFLDQLWSVSSIFRYIQDILGKTFLWVTVLRCHTKGGIVGLYDTPLFEAAKIRNLLGFPIRGLRDIQLLRK